MGRALGSAVWLGVVACSGAPTVVPEGEPEQSTAPGPASPAPVSEPAPSTDSTPAGSPDTTVPGPYQVQTSSGSRTVGSCVAPYTRFVPDADVGEVVVVLSHGFSRTEGDVADLATRFASWGLPVITTTLCHSTPFDNDPDQDAADLVALADEVGAPGRLYVGHSAGGLRSVLAAAQDPGTLAVLGLDLVDLDDLALGAAASIPVPVYGLFGEPYSCNSNGNGVAAVAGAPDGFALGVTDADHCDFEAPTDWLCTTFCDAPGATFDDPALRSTIFGLSTAFVLWQSGLEPGGETWWVPGGEAYDRLWGEGAIAPR